MKHKRKYYPRKVNPFPTVVDYLTLFSLSKQRSGKRRGIIRNKISSTKGKKPASKSIKSSKKTLRKGQ